MKIPNFKFEKELWRKDYRLVAGIDEVGRGAWAGPLVAAAVILPICQGVSSTGTIRGNLFQFFV